MVREWTRERYSVNVLLTCAGRRNYLVRYFRQALSGTGKVYAVDASEYAPALQEADTSLIVPPVNDHRYFDLIQEICETNQIQLLISLNDLELPLLARQRERFLAIGTIPVISSPAVIDTCFDKWAADSFLREHGLNSPQTFVTLEAVEKALVNQEVQFPLVVKPRWGTASTGIFYVHDAEELMLAYKWLHKSLERGMLASVSMQDKEHSVIIQEMLVGSEYGLDIVNDLQGSYVATFVKRKLAMRAGETDRAVTVEDERVEKLGYRLSRALGHIGNLDCDVFVTEKGCYILEMNPRFGGGYPFSHVAGADVPSALVAWAEGKEVADALLRVEPGVVSVKHDDLLICRGVRRDN